MNLYFDYVISNYESSFVPVFDLRLLRLTQLLLGSVQNIIDPEKSSRNLCSEETYINITATKSFTALHLM